MWNNAGGFDTNNEGGFVSSQNFDSPSTVKTQRKAQNIIPLTIKQIIEAEGDSVEIHGVEVHMAELVALVKSVNASTTKIEYVLDDGTGSINGIQWSETTEGDSNMKPPLMENTYCKAIGSIRQYQGKRNIVLFNIVPIMDLNRLTTHILEVMHNQLKLEKLQSMEGKLSSKIQGGNDAMSNSFVGSNVGGGLNVGGSSNMGLNPKQDMVYNIIKQCNSEDGASRLQLHSSLQGKLTNGQIDDIVDHLSGEGHIYSSVDEDHFRPTDT